MLFQFLPLIIFTMRTTYSFLSLFLFLEIHCLESVTYLCTICSITYNVIFIFKIEYLRIYFYYGMMLAVIASLFPE